jgi:5'-phosphate synthase pdxT subunit
MNIGILALQGCCAPHEARFKQMGVATTLVRYPEQVPELDGLVMPGGETTTMLKTAGDALWPAIQLFAETRPIWGICAGSILLARRVENPVQFSLGILDMTVERNGYGAQNESFIGTIEVALEPPCAVEAVFIRAPVIKAVGPSVVVLAECGGAPVMVSDGRHVATTFHPELSSDSTIHRYFLEIAEEACAFSTSQP